MNQKIATIIILTANASSEHTRRTIECVEKFTKLPYELLVLRDDKKYFGFSRENNRLMGIAEGKYIVLLNDDCFVSENWLERIIQEAESSPSIGLVGASLLKGSHESHAYGRPYDFGDGHLRSILTRIFRRFPLYNEWVAFALVLIKRDVVKKVGYLDETFNLGFEDNDYCLRVQNAGLDIVCSDMGVQHLTNASSKSFVNITKMVKGFLIFYRRLHWPITRILFVGTWWSLTAYSRKLFK